MNERGFSNPPKQGCAKNEPFKSCIALNNIYSHKFMQL